MLIVWLKTRTKLVIAAIIVALGTTGTVATVAAVKSVKQKRVESVLLELGDAVTAAKAVVAATPNIGEEDESLLQVAELPVVPDTDSNPDDDADTDGSMDGSRSGKGRGKSGQEEELPVVSPTPEVNKEKVVAIVSEEDYTTPVNDDYIYVPKEDVPETPKGEVAYADSISAAMCKPEYWANKSADANKVLLDADGIKQLNRKIIETSATNMYDLAGMAETYDSDAFKTALLSSAATPENGKCGYVDGVDLSTGKEAFYQQMRDNINGATVSSTDSIQYALCVKRADMKSWPTDKVVGHSATDTDDELQLAAMYVNEPAVVKLYTADKKFAYVYSSNCDGWVPSDSIAICRNKTEWLDAWAGTGDFLVVTTDRIVLEPSIKTPKISKVELDLSCRLNLVPKSDIPANVGERGTWNNYVVYLPTRASDGSYVKSIALISQHHKVHVGYLPLTEKNLTTIAFECLGNRYGWGGMLKSMDCSMYTRSIYRCCGVELPRNTNWQTVIPTANYNVSSMTVAEKESLLNTLPAGTLLKFPGHITMYLGHENVNGKEKYYVISDLGTVFREEESGDNGIYSAYSVVINSLDVRRRGAATDGNREWIAHMTDFVCPWALTEYTPGTPVDSEQIYIASENANKEKGNLTYADNVSYEMCSASYWAAKCADADRLLMDNAAIKNLNASFYATPATFMNDLEHMSEVFNAENLRNDLGTKATPTNCGFLNGGDLGEGKEAYYEAMRANIMDAPASDNASVQYVLCVKRADMKDWPTSDVLGNSATDADDEIQSGALIVNEPAIAKLTTADGRFTYVISSNCSGWVPTESIAVCGNKDEWLAAWKGEGNSFLVVTTDKIVLEPSIREADTSEVELSMSCKLNLVPEGEIPEHIAERGTWNNYVVYIPTRGASGEYVKKIALISEHHNVHVGYLPFTERSLLNVAFECLGNRYGWGGMLESMDCSMYTRNIYRCVGVELPRNTTWQTAIPSGVYNVSGMSREEKESLLNSLPVGTLLMFPGHITMYLGHENVNGDEKYYVISALGSVYREEGASDTVLSEYNVVINTLDVRRGDTAEPDNRREWISHMIYFVSPSGG